MNDDTTGESKARRAAIVIDDWKLSIFTRHLEQSGYKFEICGRLLAGTILLRIETDNIAALTEVVGAAQAEAKRIRGPQCHHERH